MERLLTMAALAAAALAIAGLVQRRARLRPTATGYHVPDHLDRGDFAGAGIPWLVAVFTSATCDTCAQVTDAVRALESDVVAVQEVELSQRRDLHERYRIDGVPALVVADHAGEVRASFVGPVRAAELRSTLDALRAEAR